MEPGRSIVGPAGITVYTVGAVKQIPNVRKYVSVDGGMADNPRYILYQSPYDAVLANNPTAEKVEPVTIAGKCCESGDLLIKDIMMPPIKPGDYLAVLATGAYNYSMASNYNRIPRPPVVMVHDGKAKLIVKRETYEDIVQNDILD
jgi:diaminopimelate decarboxylase